MKPAPPSARPERSNGSERKSENVTKRIPKAELYRLRNEVEVAALIRHLEIPWKNSEGYFRFLCPLCSDFHTATNPRTNLARCFRCRKNFNPIDLLMVVCGKSFLDAVRYLQKIRGDMPPPRVPQKTREEDHRLA
jgi:hypothetical protein